MFFASLGSDSVGSSIVRSIFKCFLFCIYIYKTNSQLYCLCYRRRSAHYVQHDRQSTVTETWPSLPYFYGQWQWQWGFEYVWDFFFMKKSFFFSLFLLVVAVFHFADFESKLFALFLFCILVCKMTDYCMLALRGLFLTRDKH